MKKLRCSRCREYKPTDKFFKSRTLTRGYTYYCIECLRERRKLPGSKLSRYKYGKKYYERRKNDPEYRIRLRKNDNARRIRDIEKIKTRLKTQGLVRRGKIKRQPCKICGSLKSQAHHKSYDNAYDVEWFCEKHHKEYHYGKTQS